MNHAVVRRVATEMLRCKGKLMELLRAEDITKTGERGMDERDVVVMVVVMRWMDGWMDGCGGR